MTPMINTRPSRQMPSRSAALAAALALSLSAAACKSAAPATPEVAEKTETPTVEDRASSTTRWHPVAAAGDVAILDVPAVVRLPSASAMVAAIPARAQVIKLHVRVGDQVTAGQLLGELRLPDLVISAAQLRSAEERIAAHKRWAGELRELRRDGLARSAELFEAEARLADLQAEKTMAEAVIRAAGVAPGEAWSLVSGQPWPLRAAQAAQVLAVEVQPGQVVDSGVALLRLQAVGEARIEVRALQALPAQAELQFVAQDGRTFDLAREPTAVAIDSADGAWLGWYGLRVPQALAQGTRGRVRLKMPEGTAVQVPARSLLHAEGEGTTQASVILRTEKGPERREVEVLAVAGPVAVVTGLAVGTLIAAEADRVALPEESTASAAEK